MSAQPESPNLDLLRHIIGDVSLAISERDGETRQQQQERHQATVRAVLAFRPRDAIEAMLASRCVMFHELSLDSARRTLKGEEDSTHRSTRGNLVALDRAFGANLTRLLRYRDLNPEIQFDDLASHTAFRQVAAPVPHTDAATAESPGDISPGDISPGDVGPGDVGPGDVGPGDVGPGDVGPGDVGSGDADTVPASATETVPAPPAAAKTVPSPPAASEIAAPAYPPAYPTEAAAARDAGPSAAPILMQYRNDHTTDPLPPWALPAPGPGVRAPEVADFPVSSESIAACMANPAAMAALKANDPAAFARALGIEPSEEFLAAAASKTSPFTQKWRTDLQQLVAAKRKTHSPKLEPA
jgi:hypothetical protein